MIQSKHTGIYFKILPLLFLRLIVCCLRPEPSKDPYFLTVLPTPGVVISLETGNGQQPTDLLFRENKGGAQMKRT